MELPPPAMGHLCHEALRRCCQAPIAQGLASRFLDRAVTTAVTQAVETFAAYAGATRHRISADVGHGAGAGAAGCDGSLGR